MLPVMVMGKIVYAVACGKEKFNIKKKRTVDGRSFLLYANSFISKIKIRKKK